MCSSMLSNVRELKHRRHCIHNGKPLGTETVAFQPLMTSNDKRGEKGNNQLPVEVMPQSGTPAYTLVSYCNSFPIPPEILCFPLSLCLIKLIFS